MNVRLERDWARMGYAVTFYERDPLRVLRIDGDGWRWEEIDAAETPSPTLFLPPDAMEALLGEAEKVIPASHATERHLSDAIAVRDRLLDLVESGWDG